MDKELDQRGLKVCSTASLGRLESEQILSYRELASGTAGQLSCCWFGVGLGAQLAVRVGGEGNESELLWVGRFWVGFYQGKKIERAVRCEGWQDVWVAKGKFSRVVSLQFDAVQSYPGCFDSKKVNTNHRPLGGDDVFCAQRGRGRR